MLISEPYRQLMTEMHKRSDFGIAWQYEVKLVRHVIKVTKPDTVLDYGSGRCGLAQALVKNKPDRKIELWSYDPAFEEIADPPDPVDLVVCLDVLEHVEPECLMDVLSDLYRVSLKNLLVTIATGPANKTLPNGWNAHLIQQPMSWWCPRFWRWGFELESAGKTSNGFWVLWQSPRIQSSRPPSPTGSTEAI